MPADTIQTMGHQQGQIERIAVTVSPLLGQQADGIILDVSCTSSSLVTQLPSQYELSTAAVSN